MTQEVEDMRSAFDDAISSGEVRTVAATLKTWPYFRRPVDDDASNEAIWDAYDRVLQRREALSGRLS